MLSHGSEAPAFPHSHPFDEEGLREVGNSEAKPPPRAERRSAADEQHATMGASLKKLLSSVFGNQDMRVRVACP